jgi:hypothetical protein
MFFKNPDELVLVYDTLEEKNLYLIQAKRENESELEEIRKKEKE